MRLNGRWLCLATGLLSYTSVAANVCSGGHYWDGTQCAACAAGQYQACMAAVRVVRPHALAAAGRQRKCDLMHGVRGGHLRLRHWVHQLHGVSLSHCPTCHDSRAARRCDAYSYANASGASACSSCAVNTVRRALTPARAPAALALVCTPCWVMRMLVADGRLPALHACMHAASLRTCRAAVGSRGGHACIGVAGSQRQARARQPCWGWQPPSAAARPATHARVARGSLSNGMDVVACEWADMHVDDTRMGSHACVCHACTDVCTRSCACCVAGLLPACTCIYTYTHIHRYIDTYYIYT